MKIIQTKEKLIKELKLFNAEKYYHNLTNKTRESLQNPFEYTYTYERFNGFIKIPNFTNDFYDLNEDYYTETYFTNCGMTAIVSVLLSLISYNNLNINLMYEETYFETIKFINGILKNKNHDLQKYLYIDSIASDFEFLEKEIYKNYIGVIIDTTCFSGKNFKKMISNILSQNLSCILVRSHTKLDLLGTEYSHIGSVSFIYSPNKNNDDLFFKKIEMDCKHLIGVIGACLAPEKFPNLLLSSEAMLLNEKRLEIVVENNTQFFNILKNHGLNIILPNHKQFCLIYLNKKDISLDELKQNIYNYSLKNEKEYITYPAVSFGFDYISIDCYQNFIDSSFKIRVCINDFPTELVTRFAQNFTEFIHELEKKL